MPLVLIPSNNGTIVPALAAEYSRWGYEVVVGNRNLFLGLHRADLVHYQWPEELTSWRAPRQRKLEEIREAVERWSRRCPGVISVHNLYPHGFHGHPTMRQLYEIFYERCTAVVHHSRTSLDLVLREFPLAKDKRHLVTGFVTFDWLLPGRPDRAACRRAFGFADDALVVLVFGQLRSWDEVRLVQKAFDRARVPGKRLLAGARYQSEGSGTWRRFSRQLRWRQWVGSRGGRPVQRFIPDEEVHRYVEAADVLLVPRLPDRQSGLATEMCSGLVPLALTFGRTVVAPDQGAHPEYLAQTENPLYKPGDAASLARAIEKAATLDRSRIEAANRALAATWRWSDIVRTALEGAGSAAPGIPAGHP